MPRELEAMTPRFRESGSLGCAWTVLSPGISWTWIRPEETRRQARCLVNRGSVFSADQSRFGPGASRLFPDLVQEPESEFLEAAKQAALGDRRVGKRNGLLVVVVAER